jgi:hypothetical protein
VELGAAAALQPHLQVALAKASHSHEVTKLAGSHEVPFQNNFQSCDDDAVRGSSSNPGIGRRCRCRRRELYFLDRYQDSAHVPAAKHSVSSSSISHASLLEAQGTRPLWLASAAFAP